MQAAGITIAAIGLAGASASLIWTGYAVNERVQVDRLNGVISACIVTAIGLALMSFEF